MTSAQRRRERGHEVYMAQPRPQQLQALSVRGQSVVPNPRLPVTKVFDARRRNPSGVPDARLAVVDLDACLHSKGFGHRGEEHLHPFRLADEIHVVQERKKVLIVLKQLLHRLQCRMLAKRIEGRHKRVALLAAFALPGAVLLAVVITPQVS